MRIILSDDHVMVQEGIRSWLEAASGMEVVAVASSGKESLEFVRILTPDVLVQDIRMPDMSGIEVVRRLRKEFSSQTLKILALSGSEQVSARSILLAGANGYCAKEESRETLLEAVRWVFEYDVEYISPLAKKHYEVSGEAIRKAGLTELEMRIVALLKEPNGDIAEFLSLSEKTVCNYLSVIYTKLRTTSRFGAIKWAERNGLLESIDSLR
jgi:NarL family two-component system response regulator LiaR